MFRQVSQIVFRKFRKYEFRKVSQIQVSQFYVCFARFARFLTQILFSSAESSSLRDAHGISTGKTSLCPAGDTGTIPFGVARAMPPPSTPARRAAPRSSLASRPAVPSPSAAAASPTSRRPVPPSASLAAPRNRAEREALAERYYPCAFCDKAQSSGDGCRLWHLHVVALTCSRDLY